jgi:hypothetical protein
LYEVSRIQRVVSDGSLEPLEPRFLKVFQSASKFYLQALQNVERDPEVAYLHLITAGEILSGFYKYEKDDLFDEQTKQQLNLIRNGVRDGLLIANFISGKLFQVKQRFVESIVRLIDSTFFGRSESGSDISGFKADTFRAAVAAAYDLRSKFVHTGVPFGGWVYGQPGASELQVGLPVVEDKELGKILAKAPTYLGLERIVRYSLLRSAQQQGAYVEPVDRIGGS